MWKKLDVREKSVSVIHLQFYSGINDPRYRGLFCIILGEKAATPPLLGQTDTEFELT